MSYIPHTDADRAEMLRAIGVSSLDDLFTPIPENLRVTDELNIPHRLDQISLARHIEDLASRNDYAGSLLWSPGVGGMPCFLGAGIYDHYIPPTVAAITGRSEFYTSYTPYQPEVSQGVLQSIFEFQTLLCELFQMDVANASMYDGATALAEAALMAADLTGRKRLAVPETVHPIYRQVLESYIKPLGIEVDLIAAPQGVVNVADAEALFSEQTAAILIQHPNFFGCLEEMQALSDLAHQQGALLVACVDPISLGLLTPPGEYGADIVVGEGQGLGCPMGYGGPLLGLFSCRQEYMRRLPGRIVGQTTAEGGKRAFVMTLRTREQDIRRERATSNICTNEALYALAATVYLSTMGKKGLSQVAELCVQKAHYAAEQICQIPGYSLAFPDAPFFKEFVVEFPIPTEGYAEHFTNSGLIGGLPLGEYYPNNPKMANAMLFCVTEQRTKEEIDALVAALPRGEKN